MGKPPPVWAELSVRPNETELNGIVGSVENDVCEDAGSLLSPLCPRVSESRPYVITLASCRSNVHHECPQCEGKYLTNGKWLRLQNTPSYVNIFCFVVFNAQSSMQHDCDVTPFTSCPFSLLVCTCALCSCPQEGQHWRGRHSSRPKRHQAKALFLA